MDTHRFLCAALALLPALQGSFSQSYDSDWDSVLETLVYSEDLSESAAEELQDLYESIRSVPINVNAATPDQLRQLPFLSESQIEDILAYVYMHGPMRTLGELQLTGLDYNTRLALRHFLCIGDPPAKYRRTSVSDMVRWGRAELCMRLDVPLYTRSGFAYHSAEELERWPNQAYLGDRLAHSVRYQFNWNGRVRAGFSADKDAGDPFFGRNRYGYDYYSPYIFLSELWKDWTVAIGNCKAGFGQGLLLGSGLGMGKQTYTAGRPATGLKPHSSIQESGYFRGVGVSRSFGHFAVTLLGAGTPVDATLSGDSMITSFKTDGYHRTPLEWSKKHNVLLETAVANLRYKYDGISVGMTVLKERLSLPEKNAHGLSGISADWSIRRAGFAAWGELAFSGRAPALLAQFEFGLPGDLSLNASFRHYSPDYRVMHSSGLSESGITNETGALIGLARSKGRVKASAYADIFHHPAACFGAGEPSFGFDTRAQLEWVPRDSDRLIMNMRFKDKQKDCKGTGQLEYCRTLRARIKWERSLPYGLKNAVQLHYTRYDFVCVPIENGWALSNALEWTKSDALNLGFSAAVFSTDGSNSSVSAYEKGLRYGFNFLTMYGKGTRLSLTARYRHGKSTFMFKFGSTIYFDRDCIGSSAQAIGSSHKEDINLQFIRKFSLNLH